MDVLWMWFADLALPFFVDPAAFPEPLNISATFSFFFSIFFVCLFLYDSRGVQLVLESTSAWLMWSGV